MADLSTLMQIDQSTAPPPVAPVGIPQYPIVAPQIASGANVEGTNLSPEDLAKFNAGQPPPLAAAPALPPQFQNWNDQSFAAKLAAAEAGTTEKPPPAPDKRPSGFLANIGAGTSQGTANALGAPVDLTTAALNLGARALGLPQIERPVGGSQWLTQVPFAAVGANPQDVVAATAGMRALREGVTMATTAGLPGGVAKMLPEAATFGGELGRRLLAAGATPTGLAASTGGGVLGSALQEVVPDRLKPLADMLGNIGGGGLTAVGLGAGQAALRAAGTIGQRMIAPLGIGARETPINPTTGEAFTPTQGGAPIQATPAQMALAGRQIAGASGQAPADLAASIPPPNAALPGQASMGQSMGSEGLLNLERTLRTQNRIPFNAQEATNNSQRIQALIGIGAPDDVHAAASDFLHRRLNDIASITPEEASAQVAAHQQAQAAMPGVAPAETGARMAEAIAQRQAPAAAASDAALAKTQTAAEAATSALGGGPETRLQAEGTTIQGAFSALDQAKQAQVSRIFGAVDPDGKLNVDMSPVISRGRAISAQVDARPNVRGPDGETAAIIDLAKGHEPVSPFQDLRDLRSRITNQLMVERGPGGRPDQVAWLSQLLTSIDNTMGSAVGEQAVRDAAAVKAGTMNPHETVGARMAAASPDGQTTGTGVPKAPTVAYVPSGRSVGVQYRVMEGDHLIASHDDDLNVNPAYPPELQPRDRSRAASQQQVQRIATRLQPELLGVSPSAMEGAPIVGPDNLVESGNARTIGIKRAMAAGGPQADAYRSYLERQGFDTTGMNTPILVRQRTTDLSPAERIQFTQEANAETGLAMSAGERARTDAGKLSPDVLGTFRGGDVTLAQNAPFVRSVAGSMLTPGEEGSFATKGGTLSLDGARRLRTALLQRAYEDPNLVGVLAEHGDEDLKALGGALTTSAGNIARLAAASETGQLAPEMAIGPRLADVARIVKEARSRGISLADQVAQRDAFAAPIHPVTQELLQAAYGPDLRGRLNQQKFSGLLDSYAQSALEQGAQRGLLGESLSPEGIINQLEARNAGRAVGASGQSLSAGVAGQGGGEGGTQALGLGAGTARPAAPGQAARGPQPVLPREPLEVNLSPEAIQRYADARAEHAQRMQVYHEQAVGDVLQPGKRKGEMVMEASRAAPALFNKGAAGAEDAQSFVRAVGGRTDEEARAAFAPMAVDENGAPSAAALEKMMQARADAKDALGRSAAFSLRQAAEEGGTLNVAKGQKWLQDHAPALDSFPDLRARFQTAIAQRQELDGLRAERAALDAAHPLAGVGQMSDLADRYWRPGPKGQESVQRYLRDAGDTPETRQIIDDRASESLRAAAFKDGVWNDAAYNAWRNRYEQALSQRPELAQKLGDVASAQQAVADSAARRIDAIKDLQNGAAAHYLTKSGDRVDPLAAINSLMGSKTAPADAAALMRAVASDPTAVAGVKRNVLDWLTNKVQAATEAGVSGDRQMKAGAFRKIIDDPKISRTMDQVFTPVERSRVGSILESAELEARAYSATAIKGSPGTAADLHALAEHGGTPTSMIMQLAVAEMGAEALSAMAGSGISEHGAILGAAAGGASIAYNAMKAAGMRRVADLAAQGLLQPELGRILVSKAIANPKAPVFQQFLRQIAMVGLQSAVAVRASRQEAKP